MRYLKRTAVAIAVAATFFVVQLPTTISADPTLIAHWTFDDASGTDSAGTYDGTVNGAIVEPGMVGNALKFDGVDDHVDLHAVPLGNTEQTFAAWINSSDYSNCFYIDCRIVSRATGTATQDHYFMVSTIIPGSGPKLRFRLKTAGFTHTLVASTGALSANTWYHVAAVYDGATMKLYLDGAEVGSMAKTGNITDETSHDFWAGSNPPTATSKPWKGLLDDLRLYDRALTPTEIQDLALIPDTTPPVRTNGMPAGVLPGGTTSTTISLDTDEDATCHFSLTPNQTIPLMDTMPVTGGTSHSLPVGSLTDGSSQTFYIICEDTSGNVNTEDFVIAVTVAVSDTTPPVRSNGAPSGELPEGTTSTTMSLNTDENATCKLSSLPNTLYENMGVTFATTGATSHAILIGALSAGGSRTFYIRCEDASGNKNTDDFVISFSIAADTTPPVRSNGMPDGELPAGTTSTTLSLDTNENATCRLSTTPNTLYDAMGVTLGITGSTLHSIGVGGLTDGSSQTYYIRCEDGSGNQNTDDFEITVAVGIPGPPVRTNGAPVGTLPAGTASTTISLDTDIDSNCRFSILADQLFADMEPFFVTGGNLHSKVVGSLVDGGSYTYYVKCEDASNSANVNTDDFLISFSVASPVIDLIAHWPFDDTSGQDIAGSNDGTVNGATSEAGTIGNALRFDGIDDHVDFGGFDVPGSALTLAAWINADDLSNCAYIDCRIFSKATGTGTQDHYIMLSTITSGGAKLRFRLKTGGFTSTLVASGGTLSNGQWYHVAAVYDGSTMKLYLDGIEVGSTGKTGAISTNAGVDAWAAGNPPTSTSRPWDGLLDDMRVYSRALTPTEIQNLALVPDTTPPVRSNGAPSGELPLDTTSTTLSLDTDETASCKYHAFPDEPYISMDFEFNNSQSTTHSTPLTSLVNGGSYTFYVRCVDDSGNENTDDFEISFTVAVPVPPVRSNGMPSGELAAGTTSTTMSLETDILANCNFDTVAGKAFNTMASEFPLPGVTTHSTTIGGLVDGGSYTYYIRCRDTNHASAVNTDDFVISFTVALPPPPVRSNGMPSGDLPAGTTSAVFSLDTDINASCRYDTSSGTAFGDMTEALATLDNLAHSEEVTGLTDGGSYSYYIRCQSTASPASLNTDDFVISFTVGLPDTTPPVRSNGAPSGVLPSGTTSQVISLDTDEAATCRFNSIAGQSYDSMNDFDSTGGMSHSTLPDPLVDGGSYNFYVRCKDASDNKNTDDFVISFSVADTPTDLIAHWPFDDTSGEDIAGSNDGTVSGAVAEAGKIGNALRFDGVNDYVDFDGFDVTGSAVTISAWVNSDDLFNCTFVDCRIFSKATGTGEQDHYMMISTVNSGGSKLRFRLKAGGTTKTLIASSGVLSNGTWHHIAATYDGSTMKLYLDGAEVGSTGKTGAIDNSAVVDAWAAGNPPSPTGRPWDGLLDDMRVYNRALSLAEIQVLADVADVTPPVRSNGAPTGTLTGGTTSTTISLDTNEDATCRYSTTASTAYGSMDPFTGVTGGTSHSTGVSGLSDAQTFTYYIRCKDGSGNENTDDFTISFFVESGPIRSNGAPGGSLPPGTTSTTISLDTDVAANCGYSSTPNTLFSNMTAMTPMAPASGTSHSAAVSGLTDGGAFTYYVRCETAPSPGSTSISDFMISFSVNAPVPGQIGNWPFDDGSAIDVSGKNNDGVVNGASPTTGKKIGTQALDFDGVDDYVDLGGLDVLADGGGAATGMTVAAWINPRDLANCGSSDCRIVSKADGLAEGNHYWMLSTIVSGGDVKLRFRLKAGGFTTTLISTDSIPENTWTHVAATYDGATMSVYVNGVLSGTTGKTGTVNSNALVDAWIGGSPSGTGDKPWAGLIDEVALYNIGLTAAEVLALMGDPAPIADISAVPESGPSPLTVDFDASGSSDPDGGTIASYSWDFGDGMTGSGVTVQKTYTADGIYDVVLTVVDDEGSIGQAQFEVTAGAQADELLVFEWDGLVTTNEHGFPWDQPPMPSANGDWTQPIDFANGTLYIRAEIRSQPVAQDMLLQFCVWQYNLTLESCTLGMEISGAPGTVGTEVITIAGMWKKNGTPMDWANPRQRNGTAIKSNVTFLPVSDYAGWNWNGENPSEWYPMDMRYTVVVVAAGGGFSGWENYVGTP